MPIQLPADVMNVNIVQDAAARLRDAIDRHGPSHRLTVKPAGGMCSNIPKRPGR